MKTTNKIWTLCKTVISKYDGVKKRWRNGQGEATNEIVGKNTTWRTGGILCR